MVSCILNTMCCSDPLAQEGYIKSGKDTRVSSKDNQSWGQGFVCVSRLIIWEKGYVLYKCYVFIC